MKDNEKETESICLIDFAGNMTENGFWADYFPETKEVVFGGKWTDIPNWKIDLCPTEDEIYEYIAETMAKEEYENFKV